jgi:ribosome-associated protein
MKRDIRIRGETISLGQLLKLEGMIDSGAEVRAFLSTMPVWVNGEREPRRGRKLYVDDVVQVDELELRLTSEDLDIRRSELRGVRRLGVVRWYKDDKGYGRITADDGEVLFVHFSDIELTATGRSRRVSGCHSCGTAGSKITVATTPQPYEPKANRTPPVTEERPAEALPTSARSKIGARTANAKQSRCMRGTRTDPLPSNCSTPHLLPLRAR